MWLSIVRNLSVVFSAWVVSFSVSGQQISLYSQFLVNSQMINPAYSGSKDGTEFILTYRNQWVNNLEGAPVTYSAAGHSQVGKKVGAGLAIVNDKIGVTNQLQVLPSVSYQIDLGKYKLNFGLNVGFYNTKNRWSDITLIQAQDPGLVTVDQSEFKPVIGSGVFVYNETSYAGLSAPNMLESNSGNAGSISYKRHYFFMVGKVFPVSEKFKIKPNLLFKYVANAPLQTDFGLAGIINDLALVGVNLRTGAGYVAYAQLFLPENISIGYAYDFMKHDFRKVAGGSHELFLTWMLSNKSKVIYSPRYF